MKKVTLFLTSLMSVGVLINCTPDECKVTFDTGEGGCAIAPQVVKYEKCATEPQGEITREPSAQYNYTFIEWQLNGETYDFNTPVTRDITLVAKWKETLREYTVYFNSCCGDLIEPQTVEYGKCITDPGAPTHEESPIYNYTFNEWQLNGETYDFNTPVTREITLVADWEETLHEYTVYFDSCGGTPINPIEVKHGEVIANPPADPEKQDLFNKYKFNGWHKILDDGQMDEKKFSFNEQIIEDIILKATYEIEEPLTYHVSATDGEKLSFTTMDDKPLNNIEVKAGGSFKFKMKALNSLNSNDIIYYVPDHIDFKIRNRSFFGKEGYQIKYDDEFRRSATVSILVGIINGDVTIAGEANEENYYTIKGNAFGCSFQADQYADRLKDYAIKFESKDGLPFPSKNEILIKVDAGPISTWVPASTRADVCEYNESTHELLVKAGSVKSSFEFLAYSSGQTCFEALPWDLIREIAYTFIPYTGESPQYFKAGDTKNITLKQDGEEQSFTHQVRIIGINHDLLDNGTRNAPLTLEFTNLITNNDGSTVIIERNVNNYNYSFEDGPLNVSFTNRGDPSSIVSRIPDDLYNNLSVVQKRVGIGKKYSTDVPYFARLFPLAVDEISRVPKEQYYDPPSGEGTRYEYYRWDDDINRRIKHPAAVSSATSNVDDEPEYYWLRSPTLGEEELAFCITNKSDSGWSPGDLIAAFDNDKCSVAPAFCI